MGWGGARPNSGPTRKRNDDKPKRTPFAAPKTVSRETSNALVMPSAGALARIIAESKSRRTPIGNPFRINPDIQHPPDARPAPTLRMAMDSCVNWSAANWSGEILNNVYGEGLTFLGYPYLSELAQRPEYRVISETIATEMTRKWIKFAATGDDDKTDKIKQLVDFLDSLKIRDKFADLALYDGLMGRSHIYIDLGMDDAELVTPICDERGKLLREKVGRDSLKRLQTVEAVWTYPLAYNALNPLAADWYAPQIWYVLGKQIHGSRLPTFIGRPLPDMLKPAYSFGGLSLSQMAKPYVDIWLQTRESVGALIHAFSVMVLKTDLSTMLAPGNAGGLLARAALFNATRDNQGLMIVNQATEDFMNVSAPISGLSDLQAQAQEHMMCLVAGTLVETDSGQVPIEDVTLSDKVMTRNGLAPIVFSGMTGLSSELVEIASKNSVLRATGWHPIWSATTSEFVNAENVDRSHLLLESRGWASTDLRSLGAGIGGGTPRRDITATRRLAAYCTEFFGKLIAATSPMVSTSTTSTTTHSTIDFQTLNSLPAVSTTRVTAVTGLIGILGTTRRLAANAVATFTRWWRGPCSVAQGANQNGTVEIEVVRRIRLSTPRPVYNLEVADGFLPEFFANGVLVHNSVARIPAVKFTGIEPKGLNSTSEGTMRAFNDSIHAYQHKLFKPNLDYIIDIAMISLWGEPDRDITYEFESLVELTDKEKGELRKLDAETGQIQIDKGVISPEEERKRVVEDPDSLYQGLDPEDVPDLLEEEQEGLQPEGGGANVDNEDAPDNDNAATPPKKAAGANDSALRSGKKYRTIATRRNRKGATRMATDAGFNEGDHPRGQPANAGQFGSGGGSSSEAKEPPAKGPSDKTRAWDDPKLLHRAAKAAKFGKAQAKIDKAVSEMEDLNGKIDEAVSGVADITPEDRASLEEGYEFDAVNELNEHLSDAAVYADTVRARLQDAHNAVAEFLGEEAHEIDAETDLDELSPSAAKAIERLTGDASANLDAVESDIESLKEIIDDLKNEDEGAYTEDDLDAKVEELRADMEQAHETIKAALTEIDSVMKGTHEETNAEEAERVAESDRWGKMTAGERESERIQQNEERRRKEDKEDEARAQKVSGLIDKAMERGWNPEFNEKGGGLIYPSEFMGENGIHSPKAIAKLYQELDRRGVAIPEKTRSYWNL